MSAKKGWNTISKAYQESVRISLEDVHYGPISPGEKELRLLGDVKGKSILEIGCGGGQNSIVLAKWCAKPVGVDISEEQIKYAKKLARRHHARVQFYVRNMEDLNMFPNEGFDIALSSHAVGYSENCGQTFREAFRVLRKGGSFVFCVGHPLNRGRVIWYGKRKLWGIGNYFDRRKRTWIWKFDDGTSAKFFGYHRTFQDYFNSIVSAGFVVEKILEPEPYPIIRMTEEEKRRIPYYWEGAEKEYDIWRRIPFTIIFKTKKPKQQSLK